MFLYKINNIFIDVFFYKFYFKQFKDMNPIPLLLNYCKYFLNVFFFFTSYSIKSFNFFYMLFCFLNRFFINKIRDNFYLFIKNYSSASSNINIMNIFLKFFKKKIYKIGNWINFSNLFIIIFNSVKFKDTSFFLNSVYKLFYYLPLRYYKILWNFIFLIFNFLNNYFFLKFSVYGVLLSIKGKIGLRGNLKKKKLLFNKGITSSSNVLFKANYAFLQLQTYIGVLGIKYYIFY